MDLQGGCDSVWSWLCPLITSDCLQQLSSVIFPPRQEGFKLNAVLSSSDYGKDLLLFSNSKFYLTPASILQSVRIYLVPTHRICVWRGTKILHFVKQTLLFNLLLVCIML